LHVLSISLCKIYTSDFQVESKDEVVTKQ
jgi:hypothetical protein